MSVRSSCRLPLLILVTALLAACNTPATRIDDNKAVFDRYPAPVQQKLAAGQIDIGYTREQTEIALGAPSSRYQRTAAAGAEEVWIYRAPGSRDYSRHAGYVGRVTGFRAAPSSSADEKMRVVFRGGKVSLIEQAIH